MLVSGGFILDSANFFAKFGKFAHRFVKKFTPKVAHRETPYCLTAVWRMILMMMALFHSSMIYRNKIFIPLV